MPIWLGEGRTVRGEIWLVNLDPNVGSEIKKSRPCVVVSPPEMHTHLRTVMVAPMTTKSRAAPYRIAVTHGGQRGLILLDQVRAVDKIRLVKKLGALSGKTLALTLSTLQEIFAP
jgi:mRNA interferase MazF